MQHQRFKRLNNNANRYLLDFDLVKEPVKAGFIPGGTLQDFRKDFWQFDINNYR